eukprot:scaffold97338_cov33-Phaeocystis_antarctica.AAC.2
MYPRSLSACVAMSSTSFAALASSTAKAAHPMSLAHVSSTFEKPPLPSEMCTLALPCQTRISSPGDG